MTSRISAKSLRPRSCTCTKDNSTLVVILPFFIPHIFCRFLQEVRPPAWNGSFFRVGVHVRADDVVGLGSFWRGHTAPGQSYYIKAANYLTAKLTVPVQYIMTTDDLRWTKRRIALDVVFQIPRPVVFQIPRPRPMEYHWTWYSRTVPTSVWCTRKVKMPDLTWHCGPPAMHW